MLNFFDSPAGNSILGLLLTYALLAAFVSSLIEAIATYLNYRGEKLRDALVRLLGNPDISLIEQLYNHPLIDPLKSSLDNKKPSYIDAKNFSKALYEILKDTNGSLSSNNFPPSSAVRQYLDSIFTKNAEDKILKELEEWFNSAMDRLSGEYKRKTQYVTFAFTFIFAVILGLDTFRLSQIYWKMPVEQLNIIVQKELSSHEDSTPKLKTAVIDSQKKHAASDASTSVASDVQEQFSNLKELPIQLVWESKNGHFVWEEGKEIYSPCAIKFFVYLIGCFITACSSLFGAPVLFDLLTKFANVRGTGVKPKQNK